MIVVQESEGGGWERERERETWGCSTIPAHRRDSIVRIWECTHTVYQFEGMFGRIP